MSQSPWKQKVGGPVYFALFGGIAFIALLYFGVKGFFSFVENQESRMNDARMYPLFAGSRGLELYAADSDGVLPIAGVWMDVTLTYVAEDLQVASRRDLYRTPDAESQTDYGIAMNSKLSSVSMSAIRDPGSTVAVFVSNDYSWNANGGAEKLRYIERERGGLVAFLGRSVGVMTVSPGEYVAWDP